MTDQNDNQTNDTPANLTAEEKAAEIDRMLMSAADARGELPTAPVRSGHPGLRCVFVPGQDPEVSYLSLEDQALAEQQAELPEEDMPDDGRDVGALLKQLADKHNQYIAELNAKVYDPNTGVASPKVTGMEREKLTLLAKQAYEDLNYEAQLGARLELQRERKAAEREQQAYDELARAHWIEQQAIKRADEMVIEERARQILKQRGNR